MTREDIMRFAHEAGVRVASHSDTIHEKNVYAHELERFAKLIADAERKACIKVCESAGPGAGPIYCAEAIKLRGRNDPR